ncbi:MAG: DinB family protein [Actinomycetota bacterium]
MPEELELRSRVWPTSVDDVRTGWPRYRSAWEEAISRAARLPAADHTASVEGEWSFVQTLRHLVFATDKWFTVPVGAGSFHPAGLPNSGSADFGWPGVDPAAELDFDAAVHAWRERADRLQDHLDTITSADLATEVEVLENGSAEVHDCIGVVFEEHFQHLRYALRDLDRLDAGRRP